MKVELIIDGRPYHCVESAGDGETVEEATKPMTVAQFLILARKKRGFKQLELASRLNTSAEYISQIERGLGTPSLSLFMHWCDWCGVKHIPTNLVMKGEV